MIGQSLKKDVFNLHMILQQAVIKFPEEKLDELTVTGHSTNYKTFMALQNMRIIIWDKSYY